MEFINFLLVSMEFIYFLSVSMEFIVRIVKKKPKKNPQNL